MFNYLISSRKARNWQFTDTGLPYLGCVVFLDNVKRNVEIAHLISQYGEGSLQAVGGALLSGPREALGIVADLSLQGVDVRDDLFGTDDVLRHVHNGLGAGQSTAAKTKKTK